MDAKTPLITQTRRLLSRYGLKARKGLAQHFLVDGNVLRLIISAAELSPDDIVIEVGSGLGILTKELARRAGRVIAIELDDKLVDILKEEMADFNNVTIIKANILDVEPASLVMQEQSPPSYKVVANLPYYITSPVLRHFLDSPVKPKMMIVMVQKEVARVIAAKPGEMSILSVAVQLYGKPRIVAYVPARSFYPAPEVDSAILKIEVYPQIPIPVTDEKSFFELVRAGFAAARKQLANSLSQGSGLPKPEVLGLLDRAGISSQRRAETLTLEEWGQLWQAYHQEAGVNK